MPKKRASARARLPLELRLRSRYSLAMWMVNLLVGLALLLFGRRLFWVFVAGVGFVVGALLATEFLTEQSEGVRLLLALALGILAAIVSVFLQRLLIGVAGFLAGGYLLHQLAVRLHYADWAWLGFLLGGILGAVLVTVLFDWALIALSSLTGATVLVQNLPLALDPTLNAILFVVLLVVGVFVQARQLAGVAAPPPPPPAAPPPDPVAPR